MNPIDDTATTRREAIKSWIAAGEYRLLEHIIPDEILGSRLGRLARREGAFPSWASILVLALATVLVSILAAVISGEFRALIDGPTIWGLIWSAGTVFLVILGIRFELHLFFDVLEESVLAAMESRSDLVDLQDWLLATFNLKKQIVFSLFFSLVLFASLLFMTNTSLVDVRLSILTASIAVGLQVGWVAYYVVPFISLPNRLGGYRLRLFSIDPSSSMVIERLVDMFNGMSLINALIVATFTFGVVLVGYLNQATMVAWVFVLWIILIALFLNNHRALGAIISRAKHQKLDEIQMMIERLEAEQDITSEATLKSMDGLIKYHDRVKASRESALDIQAGLSLLQSLLLPLIALLLANMDRLIALLSGAASP